MNAILRWWLVLTGRPYQAAGLTPDDPLDGYLDGREAS